MAAVLTEEDIHAEIRALQDKQQDAKTAHVARQGIVKMLIDDERKLKASGGENLALFLSANASAQELARANAKEASDLVKSLKSSEAALWVEANRLQQARVEAESAAKEAARKAEVQATYSPDWSSEVGVFSTFMVADTVGSKPAVHR